MYAVLVVLDRGQVLKLDDGTLPCATGENVFEKLCKIVSPFQYTKAMIMPHEIRHNGDMVYYICKYNGFLTMYRFKDIENKTW